MGRKSGLGTLLSVFVGLFLGSLSWAQTSGPRPPSQPPKTTQPRKPQQPLRPSTPTPTRDMAAARKLAQFVVLDSTKILTAHAETQKDLRVWTDDASKCLLSYQNGPMCLSPSYSMADQTSFSASSSHVFIVVHSNSKGRFFHMVMNVSKDLNSAQPIRVRLFVSSKMTSAQTIRSQIENGEFKIEFEGFSAGRLARSALDRVSKTQDPAIFFHAARALMQMDADADAKASAKAQVEKALRNSLRALFSSANATYREALLRMVRNDFPNAKDLIVSLGEQLLSASDEESRALGVLLLTEAGVRSEKVKGTLLGFLKGSNASRRKLAIEALALYPLTSREISMLLQFVLESPAELTDGLVSAAERWTIDDSVLISVRALARNENDSLRQLGVRLLVKLKSSEAQTLLVEALVDEASNLRSLAFRELKQRRLTDADYQSLSRQLSMGQAEVRRNALELLQVFRTERVRRATLQMIFDESEAVRSFARSLVTKERVKASELEIITPFLNSLKTEFRKTALEMHSAFSGDAITALIVPMMFDEAFEVRELARKLISQRTLGGESLRLLEPYLLSPNPAYRQFALTTVGSVRGVQASRLLIPLIFDDSSSVREKAREMVTQRSLADTDMVLLQSYLVDSEADNRIVAVQLVARVGKKTAESALIERLIEEEHPRVQSELRKMIKWIRGQ